MKIAIIGAGSATFSKTVVMDICLNDRLHGIDVALMDVDERRLDMIHRLTTRLSKELKAGLKLTKTLDRKKALEGADFVLNTGQVGGHDWVEAQRSLAEEHGYYRGADLFGFGFHGFSQMAFMADVAEDVMRLCPEAWLIQSSNPVFEGCTLMTRETAVKAIGLCHGHFGYHKIAKILGLDLEQVSTRIPGFNHWVWMTEFRYRGENAYPLLDEWIADGAEEYWRAYKPAYGDNQMSRAAIHMYRLFGVMPIGDTPRKVGWIYHTDIEAKKHWYGHVGGFDSEIGWGQYLENIEKKVKVIEEVALDDSKPVTETFEPKESSEQIVPIIAAIAHDIPGTYQVNVPNRGPLIPGFPEDLVVEVQAVVDRGGVHGMAEPRFAPKLFHGAMVPRWHRAEMVIESLRLGDRELLLNAMLYDPKTKSLGQAEGFLKAWLAEPRNAAVAHRFGEV